MRPSVPFPKPEVTEGLMAWRWWALTYGKWM